MLYNLCLVDILTENVLVTCMGFVPRQLWVMGDEGYMGFLCAYPAYQVGN